MAGTLRQFRALPDKTGQTTLGLRAPSYVNSVAITGGAASAITVPAGAKWVLFSSAVDFYARYDGSSAAVPAGVTDGSAAELNPGLRYIGGIDDVAAVAAISVISSSSGELTAAFWS